MKILGYRSKKVWKMVLASLFYGFIALGIIGAIASPSSEETSGTIEEVTETVEETGNEITETEVKDGTKEESEQVENTTETKEKPVVDTPKEKVKEETQLTASQQNAIRHAEIYISTMPFSKSGLIGQLEYEGYSTADATFAVNNIKVDWREQAVKHAKQYNDTMPMSRQGLIEQLQYEGHSKDDAAYAVEQLGL